jgi:hypothetical protein
MAGNETDVIVLGVGTSAVRSDHGAPGSTLVLRSATSLITPPPATGEMLGMLSLPVHTRRPLADMRSMIYAFPTFYGGIGEALGAYGRGLATVIDPSYEGFKVLDAAGASA